MLREIDTTKYTHVDNIFWGAFYESSYYHNFYYSEELKKVIYEERDDDGCFKYWEINGYSYQYLGADSSIGGIFENETGIVQLSDEY